MERNIAFESSVGSKFRMKSKQSKNDQSHALQNKNQFSKCRVVQLTINLYMQSNSQMIKFKALENQTQTK